jgi:hypothetical protein
MDAVGLSAESDYQEALLGQESCIIKRQAQRC